MELLQQLRALLSTGQQQNRLLTVSVPNGAPLVVERFSGVESVDAGGFRFQVDCLSPDAQLPLAPLLGSPVLIELQCDDSRRNLRPFHGHITACEQAGSNGGVARYRLQVEPWLALLHHRTDSYAFHNLTVEEIVERVFEHYAQGVVVPARRWALSGTYLNRSVTSQYQETDFAFITRLLAEEGIFYWFEHEGDKQSPTLGKHTLVLSDSNANFAVGKAKTLRFHRADATEAEDTIQQWQPQRRWQGGELKRASWDYRTLSNRQVVAQATGQSAPAVDDDMSGPYAYATHAHGEQRIQQHLDAKEVPAFTVTGAGTVRRLAPGMSFSLSGHATQAATAQVCLSVRHEARNNFDATMRQQLDTLLGRLWESHPTTEDTPPFYQNHFTALDAKHSYRPRTPEGHGLRHQPTPTVMGGQSAIVVGAEGPVHTDRDHRVMVQQHWQRGSLSASRLAHPHRRDNATAEAVPGTWARVATPVAGSNWGSVFTPRVGQEVWLAYLEGDIDRPVVVASLYNGQGQEDAPHNQVTQGGSGATGNAPMWFSGNEHGGVFSGLKTQDLSTSAEGTGGYRQLRFDDSPQQSGITLSTTDYDTALYLGHIKHAPDNAREADKGYGVALTTAAQGAIRAGKGLLLSSAAGQDAMDAQNAVAMHEHAQALATQLADVAAKQGANLKGEPAAEDLPAIHAHTPLMEALSATEEGTDLGQGGTGTATAWSDPHLVVHGQAGLVATTPQSAIYSTADTLSLTAGEHLNVAVQGQFSAVATQGIALYTQGEKQGKSSIDATGIKLHAATGRVSIEAQSDSATLAAQEHVTLSSQANVSLGGSDELLLNAGNAYIKLSGGNIEIGGPGAAEFKAAIKQLEGPGGGSVPTAAMATGQATGGIERACQYALNNADSAGDGIVPLG